MRYRAVFVFAVCLLWLPALPAPAVAQEPSPTCADFDAWEWAQLVFETSPVDLPGLDPDGNGIACEQLPRGGFPPVTWTDTIPADAQPAELVRVVDGDTLEVLIDGVSNRVRIYRADTPENQNERHCGGDEASAFTSWALGFNDEGTRIYLERDTNTRDRYGRELAYVWFLVDGNPYMLNHLLITTGWAEDVDYGDRKYDDHLKRGASFAQQHQIGVYELCGDFELPEPGSGGPAPSQPAPGTEVPTSIPTEAPYVPTEAPYVPTEPPYVPPTETQVPAQSGCDPNYTPCVPLVNYDLDCADIGHSVTVIGGDPHGFDGDGDGYGCESW